MKLTVIYKLSSYFNSIKVRLKRYIRLRRRHYSLFQFHKGTIKTDYYSNCLSQPLFQFHKGTIKTRLASVNADLSPISIP